MRGWSQDIAEALADGVSDALLVLLVDLGALLHEVDAGAGLLYSKSGYEILLE